MSGADKDMRAIKDDPALAKALDGFAVPPLSDDFADRVVAATEGRTAPLPEARRAAGRWRSMKRLAIGAVAAGALGTAAAATGLLEELGVDLPSAEEVWSTITGEDRAPEPAPVAPPQPPAAETETRSQIEGLIDTPEELEEAFRRVDEVRSERRETRRDRVDQRIDNAIEARRAQGLPAPTAEQEERLRERLEERRLRRDERIDDRLEERRDALRDQVENGEEITREDILPNRGENAPVRDRLRRLRDMEPEQRRELIQRLRERRQQRFEDLEQGSEPPLPTEELPESAPPDKPADLPE